MNNIHRSRSNTKDCHGPCLNLGSASIPHHPVHQASLPRLPGQCQHALLVVHLHADFSHPLGLPSCEHLRSFPESFLITHHRGMSALGCSFSFGHTHVCPD